MTVSESGKVAEGRIAVICGRCVLAATLCDRYRASLRDPHGACSPPTPKSRTMTVSESGKVAGCRIAVIGGRCIVHRLCVTAIAHPCATRTVRVRPHTKKQDYDRWVIVLLFGADGGGRTRTVLLPTDFESVTSANSITSADIVFAKAHCVTK